MMSIRVVNAGDGYAYLLRSVATNDERTDSKTRLGNYYDAKGTPPGRWFGSGLEALKSDGASNGNTVTEDQMAALYGEGLHPDADEMIRAGASVKDTQLGRKFPLYTGGNDMLKALSAAEKAFRESHDRRPDMAERNEIALAVARPFYEKTTGYEHSGAREVLGWVNDVKQKTKQANCGFDLTFSPTKSISVLWSVADDETRKQIEAIHTSCVNDTLAWIESDVLRTRCEIGGVQQITKTGGMIAAQFTHYDTRAGDPDLHTHCLVSNKVQGPDGVWRSVDSRMMLKHSATASQRYNAMLAERLTQQMGLSFYARGGENGKQPTWEVAGIDERILDSFSKRRAAASVRYEELASDYRQKFGRTPSRRTVYDLWQQAVLDTRQHKREGLSLAQLRDDWASEAAELMGDSEAVADMVARCRTSTDQRPMFADNGSTSAASQLASVADASLAAVSARRAEFSRRHVDTAISQELHAFRFTSEQHRAQAHAAALETAMGQCVSLNPQVQWQVPQRLISEDGTVFDRDADHQRFTLPATLEAENTVLDSAAEPTAHLISGAAVDDALERFATEKGFSLNAGQAQMVRSLGTSGMQTVAGVGPAGTGKTTSMSVLTDLWREAGHQVHALAPSAQAAKQLGEDIDAEATTLASVTYRWRGTVGNRPRDISALGVDISAGDMLLVDEAGMATTDDLAAIVEIATATGAVVRMVGDPQQLDAVETGGLFRTLCKRTDAVELDQVMRVGDDTAQAEAGLKLRHGDVDGLDLFFERGWVRDGARSEMLTKAAQAYLEDVRQGRTSLLMAATNEDVNTANSLIQAALIADGTINAEGPSVALAHGNATAGDMILARRNQYIGEGNDRQRVLNGQRMSVVEVRENGSILAKSEADRLVELPASYVAEHVQLGYAATVHRAQGATVDTAHAVVDPSVDRRAFYVAMTRAKRESRAWVVTDIAPDTEAEDGHQHMSGDETPDARSILESVVSRDTGAVTAEEIRQELHSEEFSDERASRLYKAATAALAHDYGLVVAQQIFDEIPARMADQISDVQREMIARTVATATLDGTDVAERMATVTRMSGTERDVPAVIAARIRDLPSQQQGDLACIAPSHAGADADLRLFAWELRMRLEHPEPVPPAEPSEKDKLRAIVDQAFDDAFKQRAEENTIFGEDEPLFTSSLFEENEDGFDLGL